MVCYNDLEAKPLDVLNGSEPGDAARAGSKPDLTHIGVPVAPALPDATPQATEVLDFGGDVIIFSAQGADCWNFVDAMGRLGWTPDQTPLVLSGACTDFTAMAAAGDLAEGHLPDGHRERHPLRRSTASRVSSSTTPPPTRPRAWSTA